MALAKMTINPARILRIDRGTLKIGAEADVTIIDPEARWTVDPARFRSQSSNTPFAGWEWAVGSSSAATPSTAEDGSRRPAPLSARSARSPTTAGEPARVPAV